MPSLTLKTHQFNVTNVQYGRSSIVEKLVLAGVIREPSTKRLIDLGQNLK